MKSAWIVTQEDTSNLKEVIGILSSRKAAKAVKEYVEWLYALIHCRPETHWNASRFKNPDTLCEMEHFAPDCIISRGNPYLVARRAKNLVLSNEDSDAPTLKWNEPDRLIEDPNTHFIIADYEVGNNFGE